MNPEQTRSNMSTETKNKLTPTEERRLLDLASILHSAYISTGTKRLPVIENRETIAEMFKSLLEERLPNLELREEVSKKIERWKKAKDSGAYSPEEISQNVMDDIGRESKLYIDSARHIMMYNRRYIEDTLENTLDEIFKPETTGLDNFYQTALVFFDLNGLKTLNDGTNHANGDRALEIFSKILKEGKTTKWLKEQGVEVIPAHQSGDEFILLARGKKDISPLFEEIKNRYHQEVEDFDASDLIDFQTGKKYLTELGIYDKFVDDLAKKKGTSREKLEESFTREFKFQLGTSVGISTPGEALSRIDPDGAINPKERDPKKIISFRNAPYKAKIATIRGIMANIADENANADKVKVKAATAKAYPLLGVLQNRLINSTDKENTEERAALLLENSQIKTENTKLLEEIALLRAQINQK